jgi:biopolymer transport protein ExbB
MSTMADGIQGIQEFIDRGGWVMWPLLIMSVAALTLLFERGLFWCRMHGPRSRPRVERLIELLRNGRADEVRGLIEADTSVYADVARQLLAHGTSEAAVIGAVESQKSRLFRFMPTLGTIITAAPMLGILGTVTGIISSFEGLSGIEGSAKPTEVGAGIAEALLTTVAGLVIAVVTLFPYNAFRAQIDLAYGRVDVLIASARAGLGKKNDD